MDLTLIRHTSVDVPRGTCYGQTDVPLAPTFADEARLVKEKLSGRNFETVFTSPLSRCSRLAEFCGYGNAVHDRRLAEMDFGKWEMKPFNEIDDPRLQLWYDDFINIAPTDGESFAQMRARVADFLEELARQHRNQVAIFTHGGTIMQILLYAGKHTIDDIFQHQPAYGAIVEVSIDR